MPQAKRSLGLIYAVNTFGADHQSSEHDPMIEEGSASELDMVRQKLLVFDHTLAPRSLDRDKVRYAFRTQQMYSFLESADLCQFVYSPAWTLYGPAETVEVAKTLTSWGDFSLGEMLLVGERRINMMRPFNAREGLDREDDKLRPNISWLCKEPVRRRGLHWTWKRSSTPRTCTTIWQPGIKRTNCPELRRYRA